MPSRSKAENSEASSEADGLALVITHAECAASSSERCTVVVVKGRRAITWQGASGARVGALAFASGERSVSVCVCLAIGGVWARVCLQSRRSRKAIVEEDQFGDNKLVVSFAKGPLVRSKSVVFRKN